MQSIKYSYIPDFFANLYVICKYSAGSMHEPAGICHYNSDGE
jgi:hypothetical protein